MTESGIGSKCDYLDSGSTLYFLFEKFPEKMESRYFIDTRVLYRSARNDGPLENSRPRRTPKTESRHFGKEQQPG